MKTSLLPIGTVVELKNGQSQVMIAGYCPMGTARLGYVWDYSGFVYPVGYQAANQVVQFDNEQIAKVVAMGYQDEEQFHFMEKLIPEVERLKARQESAAKEDEANV